MASKIHRAGEDLAYEQFQWRRAASALPDDLRCEAAPATQAIQRVRSTDAAIEEGRARLEAQFRGEAEQLRRAAFEEGRAAGRQEARAELEGVMRQLSHSIEVLAGMKPRFRQEVEREVVSLSLSIARRILRREMQVDRDALLGLVKAAFENVSMREVTLVRTHISHAEQIRRYLSGLGAPECIEVRGDASLEPGGVVVETARGSLDASLETQLEEIGNGLSDVLNGGGGR
ncbi:MAG: hypothetical protein HY821_04010 [Acidobacteria bacterium]|nr:hypothetical protein [Acidobacteriota bacterium]